MGIIKVAPYKSISMIGKAISMLKQTFFSFFGLKKISISTLWKFFLNSERSQLYFHYIVDICAVTD